jgi:hypothetical protein
MEATETKSYSESIYKILIEAVDSGDFISVYDDEDDVGRFSVGRVLKVFDEYYLFERYARYGLHDGFSISPIDEIYQIDVGGRYNSKIEKLVGINNQKIVMPSLETESHILDLLKYALSNSYLVELTLLDDDSVNSMGLVVGINSDSVVIEQLNYYAQSDGRATVLLSSITELTCNTRECQAIRLLYFADK